MVEIKEALEDIQQQLNTFFIFIGNKLKNFKNITRGEQISYVAVGTGILLILVSLVLFVV
ncbi:hypothetical protein HYX13_01710 [Candidatus Woesearchaeota archaeon]|nr:hypothetical protein [Candidatus Woesearchaeota archaeon]